jgi:hypothetical protein
MLRTRSRLALSLAVALGLLALVASQRTSRASHGSWVRHDGGTLCHQQGWGGAQNGLVFKEGAENQLNVPFGTSRVVCPVNLAGIFQSTETPPIVPLHTNTTALLAEVYYQDGHTTHTVQCFMVALTSTGSTSFSGTRWGCATSGGCDNAPVGNDNFTGAGMLSFADVDGSHQPRRLGVADALTLNDVRSLSFVCDIPVKAGGGTSAIIGVKTAICGNDASVSGACFGI